MLKLSDSLVLYLNGSFLNVSSKKITLQKSVRKDTPIWYHEKNEVSTFEDMIKKSSHQPGDHSRPEMSLFFKHKQRETPWKKEKK